MRNNNFDYFITQRELITMLSMYLKYVGDGVNASCYGVMYGPEGGFLHGVLPIL